MTNSINEILNQRGNSQPTEIKIIKDYVWDKFNKEVNIVINNDKIRIETSNSALAGELRFRIYELQKLLTTKKKLVILIV